MSIALKDLSLNNRLDKLEDELRVMLLFSTKEKNKCQDDQASCNCFCPEEVSSHSQDCNCIESSKPVEEPEISAKNFRSRSAPEKRKMKIHSSNSPDKDFPKREIDRILQIFQDSNFKETKKKRHCICENTTSEFLKENKENLTPIDIRTPPRKSRPKKKYRENKTIKRLKSSSQTDSLEIINDSVHEELCCCRSRPLCSCEISKAETRHHCTNRAADLESEITILRRELTAISTSKIEADKLKEKYEELQCCKMQFELELQHLRNENKQLAENLRVEKNVRVSKVEEVQGEAKLLVEKMRFEEDSLVKELESKNAMIRRLAKATDDLTTSIHEKEQENCAMTCKIREIETTTKLATQKINHLQDTNRQLARSVLDKHHSLQNCQNKTCKFKREVKDYKAKVEQSLQEIQRLQDVGRVCECVKKSARTSIFCQEEADTNTVKELVNKISSLENIQLQNIAKMAKKNKVLQSGFDNLFQMMTCGDNASKNPCWYINSKDYKCQEFKGKCLELKEKCQELKEEIKCLKHKGKQRDSERQEIKLLIEELTLLLKKQKERLHEFQELNDKQAQMLVAQESVIASHNEQVTLIEMENRIIKKKCNDLEKDTRETKDIVCSPLKKQLAQLRLILAEDQDSLKIKEKIIEDQTNTIIDLKKTLQTNSGVTLNIMNQGLTQQQELKKAREESDEKIRILDYENSILRQEVQEMRESRTKLQTQIAAIDAHIARDYRAQAEQLDRQKETITDLRRMMTDETKEHELQMGVLMKDMNSAKMTARYATQKLEETLRDFQKQTNSQMQVRDILTGMLKEKDSKLKNAIVKMSSLTLDPTSIAAAISRQKQPSHLKELNQFLNISDFDTIETTTKVVTTIVDEPPSSDFQKQLRHLVPSELYTNNAWGRKNVRALKMADDDDEVVNRKENSDTCGYDMGPCFPPEELYCSGTSGSSISGTGTSSGSTRSNREKERKKERKNIFLPPYIEDDDPTYIYVPKFRPTSPVSPFKSPQAFVPKQSIDVPVCNTNMATKINSRNYNTSESRSAVDFCPKNEDRFLKRTCKCIGKDKCTCGAY